MILKKSLKTIKMLLINYLEILTEDIGSGEKIKFFKILFNGEKILKNFIQYCLENNNLSFTLENLKQMLIYLLNNYTETDKDVQKKIQKILQILNPYINTFINKNKIIKSYSRTPTEEIEKIIDKINIDEIHKTPTITT